MTVFDERTGWGSNKLLQSRTGLDKIPPIFEKKVVLKYCLRGYFVRKIEKLSPPNPYTREACPLHVYVFSRGDFSLFKVQAANS